MQNTKFKYELTGRYGTNLYEALRERDFYNLENKLTQECLEEVKVGGADREGYIWWLEEVLSYIKWAACAKRAEVSSDNLSEWLVEHELLSDDDESDLMERYSREYAINMVSGDRSWTDHGRDDVEVALNFGLIKIKDLPQETQRKIEFLCKRANKYNEKELSEIALRLRNYAVRLEKEAAEKLILVTGFHCDIHGGHAEFKEPISRSEVLTCPACSHPICPTCANCYKEDPATVDKGREYIASCESVSGHAYCGDCGDYSVEFMLRFLKLVGCPIPPECEDFKPIPREAKFYMTSTVAALPNKDSIMQTAVAEFNKGTTGIIKIQDTTGEIWAYPERDPEEGWRVVIMRPEER